MMSFLTAVVTSRYPTTNNQPAKGPPSSNPRQQATIYDGKVTVQPVQGRETTYAAGTTRKYTPRASGSNTGKQRTNALMANLSKNGLEMHSTEVYNPDNLTYDLIDQSEQIMMSSEQSNDVSQTETEITSDSNIIPYSQYPSETQQEAVQNSNSSAQQDVLILSMFEQLNTQVMHCTNVNLEYKSANKALTTKLDRYKEEVKDLKENQNVENNFSGSNEHEHAYWKATSVPALDLSHSSTIVKVEVPKELPKVSMVYTSLKELKRYLTGFDMVVKERTTATAITEGTWGFEHTKAEKALVLRDIVEHVTANYPQDSLLRGCAKSSSGIWDLRLLDKQHDRKIALRPPISSVTPCLEVALSSTPMLHSQSEKDMDLSEVSLSSILKRITSISACAIGKSQRNPTEPKSEDTKSRKTLICYAYGSMWDQWRVRECQRKEVTSSLLRLKETVRRIRTDNGTEFDNQTLRKYYEKVDISHETSVALSQQQNGVVERRNRTLIEAIAAMLLYAKAPYFYGPKRLPLPCYTPKSFHDTFVVTLTAMASDTAVQTPLHELTSNNQFRTPCKPVPHLQHQFKPPSRSDWNYCFKPMFDEHELAFANSDHAGCQDTRRSTSGSIQLLGDRLVSWSSKRQKSAAISSMGSRIYSWVRLFVLKSLFEITTYRLCLLDSIKLPMHWITKALLALCCNNVQHSISKHIDIRFHFIKEHVENGVIELYFVPYVVTIGGDYLH
ncbi:retrovirus-related pol polyprotein from transposon TNT 1-94 [Tanacetum coccineum]